MASRPTISICQGCGAAFPVAKKGLVPRYCKRSCNPKNRLAASIREAKYTKTAEGRAARIRASTTHYHSHKGELPDYIVANLLRMKKKAVTPHLLNLKREQITIHRLARKLKEAAHETSKDNT